MTGGLGRDDVGKLMRDRIAANLSRLMEHAGMDVEELSGRSGVDPDVVRLVLLGEDEELNTTTCFILASAAGGTMDDLQEGITFVPYYDRPGGEMKVESID